MTDLLMAQAITVRFGGLEAISGLHMAIRPGTIHGLIGPNGAGKTTMLNVLAGNILPTSGQITFDDVDITKLGVAKVAAQGIARTFQNIRLFGGMTVLESLLVGAHREFEASVFHLIFRTKAAREQERAIIDRAYGLLDFVGLGREVANTVAITLSYGHQRRVEIARAMMLRPKLLLLDEPLAGMNAHEKTEIASLIRTVRSQGATVLLIEHDMEVVRTVCDHLTVMNYGKRLADGPTEEVLSLPEVHAAYLGRARA